MSHFPSPKAALDPAFFTPCQIVYLEHHDQRLYAEVIQTVAVKQICWVRPLVLAAAGVDAFAPGAIADSVVYDLRECSDLLLPVQLFRVALDVDVIPLLMHLTELAPETQSALRSRHNQQMHQFVRDVCLAHPEAFEAQSSTDQARD